MNRNKIMTKKIKSKIKTKIKIETKNMSISETTALFFLQT